MSKNSYLNLRFVNIIQSIRATPYTAAELYSASYVRSFSDIEQTGRLLRQARVESCADFEDYLISLRDVNAWKIGVFKFFYNFFIFSIIFYHLSLKFSIGIKINCSNWWPCTINPVVCYNRFIRYTIKINFVSIIIFIKFLT